MTTPQKIIVKYALGSPDDHGDVYDTAEEARQSALYSACGYPVLKLYVDPDGKIVHTEAVSS